MTDGAPQRRGTVVHKVLNNNVVISLDEQGRERVLMGRGLGFQLKPTDTIDPAKVEKTFILEGSFRAVVSGFSGEGNRGSAHGVFQSVVGALAFAASVVAGALWTWVGPAAPFWFGAACAGAASAALFALARRTGAGA